MISYENFLSRALGFKVRRRALKRALGWVLLLAALITPVAFTQAVLDYGQRRAERVTKWILNPVMNSIQKNFEEQMVDAQRRAKVAPQDRKDKSRSADLGR